MSSSKSLAGQILRWFYDRRSGHKKDEQATGRPRTRGQRGSCPLDQESTFDMVLLDMVFSLTTNQRTVLSVMTFQRNEQGHMLLYSQ